MSKVDSVEKDVSVEGLGLVVPKKSPEEVAENTSKPVKKAISVESKEYIDSLKKRYDVEDISMIHEEIRDKWGKLLKETFDKEVVYDYKVRDTVFDLFIDGLLIDIPAMATHNVSKSLECIISECSPGCENHSTVSNDYLYKRALVAKEHDYSLISIYDWDDEDKILDLIAGKVMPGFKKISAKSLQNQRITQLEANRFLKKYHIQGGSAKQEYCYGLHTKGGELIAVATFSKPRYNKNYEWEWNRYAVKHRHIIHGGSKRLWNAFLREAEPSNVISYVDFNHTSKQKIFLSSLGFEEIRDTGPTGIWFNGFKKVADTSLLKVGADRLLQTSYGTPEECGMNNVQIMAKEGFLKIYTAGNRVFVWEA